MYRPQMGFNTGYSAVSAYQNVGIETSVTSADPHRLIVMLFEGAEVAITQAKLALSQGEIARKGECISKAINIIDNGLKASLDMEAGGEIAAKLAALYDYMGQRLLWANLKNDAASLDEVFSLLRELSDAWAQITPRGDADSPKP